MRQGDMTLENLWQKFQDLWISIDNQDPNPMDTPTSIEKYNKYTQRHRLYQFIWALDEKYDKIKREILNMEPLPTAHKAYGLVRRESLNEKLMHPEPKATGIGVGLAVIDRSRPAITQSHQPPRHLTHRKEEDKTKLVCSHCGGKRHTKETCFHIHGFPEWWEELKKNRQPRNNNRTSGGGRGRASAAVTIDRAAYADKSAGGVGLNTKSDGEEQSEEKTAKASVSVARVWTKGEDGIKITGNHNPTVTGFPPAAARVRGVKEADEIERR